MRGTAGGGLHPAILGGLLWLAGCGQPAPGPDEAPPPPPGPTAPAAPAAPSTPDRIIPEGAPLPDRPERIVVGAPCVVDVALAPPRREVKSPLATTSNPELDRARSVLLSIVRDHGRDPDNPWAVGHAILALGPEVRLTNGESAVDYLFAEYAELQQVGGQPGLAFPPRRGPIRVEPHTDLFLKAFTEAGLEPGREVRVDGQTHRLDALYRRSLCAAWVDGDQMSFQTWNDAPWALQGLAAWAPPGLSWTADGGHPMRLDELTSALVAELEAQTAFLREARAAGRTVQKRKQGIFHFTCGGAHLLQGAIWAVGRGFGTAADREAIQREVSTHLWRVDLELAAVDPLIQSRPEYADLLLIQRVKYLGHALETVHKAAAMGLYTPSAEERELLERVARELARTVLDIEARGLVEDLDAIRQRREQTWLDYIGDSAHALRAIDLHTGLGTVRY